MSVPPRSVWAAAQASLLRRSVVRTVERLDLVVTPGERPLVVRWDRVVLPVEDRSGIQYIAKGARRRRVAREASAHRWFAAEGIPVPKLLHFVETKPQVLVMERLPGPDLPSGPSDGWRAAGALLRKIHVVPEHAPAGTARRPPVPGRWLSEIASQTTKAVQAELLSPGMASEILGLARQRAPDLEPPHVATVVHGDCMPKHLMYDRHGNLLAIDVESSGVDDPAWDIGVLCAFDPDRLEDVLEGYAPDAADERRLRRIIPAYQLQRLVRSMNCNHATGYPLPPVVAALRSLLGSS